MARADKRYLRVVTLFALVSAAVAATSLGCGGGCRGSKAPLQYVSHDALAVIEIPSVSRGVRHALAFVEHFKQGALATTLIATKKGQLEKQLGFAIDKPDAYRAKGIEPKAGLVISLDSEGMVTVAMPVAKADALDKYLRELLTRQLPGSPVFKDKEQDGLKVTLVTGSAAASGAQGGWAFHGKHLLLAIGKGDVAQTLAGLTKLKKTAKDNATLQRLRKRLGDTDIMVYVDGAAARQRLQRRFDERVKEASEWSRKRLRAEKELAEGVLSYFEGWAVGLELRQKMISLRSTVAMPEAKAKVLRGILSGKGSAPELGKFIGPDALVVARGSLQLKLLIDRALELIPPRAKRRLYRQIERFERRNNISVEKDLLALLAGRYAFALFAPTAEALQQPPTSVAEAARMVQMALFAQVADEKKAAEMLRRLERFLVMARVDVRTRTRDQRKVYTLERSGKALVSWTLVKNVLVVASEKRLDSTLTLITKGGKNVLSQVRSSRAKSLLRDGNGNVLYQDLSKALDTVRAVNLPTKIKLLLTPLLGSLAKFDDLTVGLVAEPQGLYGELIVNLK